MTAKDSATATAPEQAPMRWLTIPNLVSLVRVIVFVPLTCWLIMQDGLELWATISLALFGATDWIDGALARGLGQVSRVGEILDPIADRIGLVIIVAVLVIEGYVPLWVVAVIFGCDLVLGVIGLFRWKRVQEGKVTWLGKVRTAIIMIALPLNLLAQAPEITWAPLAAIAYWLLVAGTILHVAAFFSYAFRYLSGKPSPVARTDGRTELF